MHADRVRTALPLQGIAVNNAYGKGWMAERALQVPGDALQGFQPGVSTFAPVIVRTLLLPGVQLQGLQSDA